MHMADALISPLVAGTMLAITAGVVTYSARKAGRELDNKKIPLMGVMGAFIFTAQMINFTIPGTGSSGHIGGGVLLAILLGPYTGFLTMASVLLIQALFFADGGLLAYGCNVINLGFFACFLIYPLVYKWITRSGLNKRNIVIASLVSVVVTMQLGAFSVVLETFFSGKTDLPFTTFVLLMQPIHLAISIIEGLVTGAVVTFIWQARPEILECNNQKLAQGLPMKKLLTGLTLAAILLGAGLSWLASTNPDGLEWSMLRTSGSTELQAADKLHKTVSQWQEKLAFLPDYSFKASEDISQPAEKPTETWPAVNAGTSVSGLLGGALTLLLAVITGLIVSWIKSRRNRFVS